MSKKTKKLKIIPGAATNPKSSYENSRFTPELRESLVKHIQAGDDNSIRRLIEGLFVASGEYDPDSNLSATQGGSLFYRRLTENPSRDLNPLTQARSLEIAYWLYDTNPMAKRVLELTRDYILGEGVKIKAQSDDEKEREIMQSVIDRFWADPYNQLNIKLHSHVLELGLFGEQIYPVVVNHVDGSVRLGYLDPAVISTVNVDFMNVGVPLEVVTGNTLTELATINTEAHRFKIIDLETNPNDEWYGRLKTVETTNDGVVIETFVPKDSKGNIVGEAVPYLGGCFLFQINKATNSRRGRSDLLALADWVDGYDQIIFGEIDRMLLMRNFIWDVTMQGATDHQIKDYMEKNKSPHPGSVRVHNDKVTWTAVTPDLQETDVTKGADIISSYIATGAGHPKTWLNGLMDVNKGSATELGEPAFKRLTSRQKYVRYMLEHILVFQLDQAEKKGIIKKRDAQDGSLLPKPWRFEIDLPEIRARDLATNSTAFLQAMQALVLGMESQVIDGHAAQEVIIMFLGQLGVNIDLISLRKRIEDMQAELQKQQLAMAKAGNVSQFPSNQVPKTSANHETNQANSMASQLKTMVKSTPTTPSANAGKK